MGVEIVDRKVAASGVNVWPPVVANGILCVRGGDAALPKLLWDFLLAITLPLRAAARVCDCDAAITGIRDVLFY